MSIVYVCDEDRPEGHNNYRENKKIVTINTNAALTPTHVCDARQCHTWFVDTSIAVLRFAYCPWSVYTSLEKWLPKVRIGGMVEFFGPTYDTLMPVGGTVRDTQTFKRTLVNAIRTSHTKFNKVLNNTQPYVVLVRIA